MGSYSVPPYLLTSSSSAYCWQTVVTVGGGKTVEDVKRYYQETPLVIVGKCFSLNIY
jgi:hypothetical protein